MSSVEEQGAEQSFSSAERTYGDSNGSLLEQLETLKERLAGFLKSLVTDEISLEEVVAGLNGEAPNNCGRLEGDLGVIIATYDGLAGQITDLENSIAEQAETPLAVTSGSADYGTVNREIEDAQSAREKELTEERTQQILRLEERLKDIDGFIDEKTPELIEKVLESSRIRDAETEAGAKRQEAVPGVEPLPSRSGGYGDERRRLLEARKAELRRQTGAPEKIDTPNPDAKFVDIDIGSLGDLPQERWEKPA